MNRLTTWLRGIAPNIGWTLFGAIAGVVLFFPGQYIYNKAKSKVPRPYVAIVVETESVDFPIPAEFFNGFQSMYVGGATYFETHDGERVDIRLVEDLEAPEEASRIATDLASDKNCIMVIGNSNSTLTDKSLDIFLRSGDPPTYIWPIATANELITKAHTAGDGAVLRMVPSNEAQAAMIQRLTKHLAPRGRVAIFLDDENPFYSTNLSRDIASKIRKEGGQIVIEEVLGQGNSIYPAVQAWNSAKSRPDVIVWVGVAHHGLLLIDQLAALGIKTPIIFTDGALVSELMDNITRIQNRAFVLSPVGLLQETASQMPTYKGIGKDAYQLAQLIIRNSDDLSRSGLRKNVSSHKEDIHLPNAEAGSYRFDVDGNNQDATWKVFEITKGNFKQYHE